MRHPRQHEPVTRDRLCAAMSSGAAAGPIRMAAPVIFFSVGAAVTRAEIPVLCADLAALVSGRDGGVVVCDGGVVVCDVTGVARPDVVTVEALARLRLTARRRGWRLVVGGAGRDLRALLRLLGLAEVLPEASAGALPEVLSQASAGTLPEAVLSETGRQPEEREQSGGVEEIVDRRDPAG